ncbi:MAG: MBOAT family O-acyltransferase [Halioglobus sp.]|nr:MBOAT family O-acyltransferase [Halioglobus sp.]
MLEITTAIFLTLLGSAIYHLIPAQRLHLRLSYVAALSFFVILAYHPIAAVSAGAMGSFAWLLARLARRNVVMKKYGPYSLIVPLVFFGYEDIFIDVNIYDKTLLQFGMSFYVLRLYLALRSAAARNEKVGLAEFLTIALFFPIFAAGPICAQEAFSQSSTQLRPLLRNYLTGFLRIGMGIFSLYFVTAIVADLSIPLRQIDNYAVQWQEMGALRTYLVMMLNFIDLYANFSGYTAIAIGLGLFFGFDIPENFRYPYLATSISNFWQRWHLSLSRFIKNYIYMQLLRMFRKPLLSLFLAFSLVGLWHEINLQYAVWGMGHGAMLVACIIFSRSSLRSTIVARLPSQVWTSMSWILTMSLVAFFSTFANQPNFAQSLAFTQALVTGW